tara:strand:+ start:267 stop:467 length:201 start_codon:yes stop_codon:yes gene_type:complete
VTLASVQVNDNAGWQRNLWPHYRKTKEKKEEKRQEEKEHEAPWLLKDVSLRPRNGMSLLTKSYTQK